MTTAKTLSRFYDRLRPEERFRLVLLAAAREDYREVERLRDSCPRKRYEAIDREYAGLVEASKNMATAALIGIVDRLARYQVYGWMLDAIREAAEPAVEAEPRALNDEVERIRREATAKVWEVLEGFGRFTREEWGLEPETVLAAWYPGLLPKLEAVPKAEPDPAAVKEWADGLKALWRTVRADNSCRYHPFQP